jgi:hypothetical protein
MPWVGFEPMIPAFQRAKTVQDLDARLLWPAMIQLGGSNIQYIHWIPYIPEID